MATPVSSECSFCDRTFANDLALKTHFNAQHIGEHPSSEHEVTSKSSKNVAFEEELSSGLESDSRRQSGKSKHDSTITCTTTREDAKQIVLEEEAENEQKEIMDVDKATNHAAKRSYPKEELAIRYRKNFHKAFETISADQGTPYPCTQTLLDKTLRIRSRNKSTAVDLKKAVMDAIVSLFQLSLSLLRSLNGTAVSTREPIYL